MRYAPQIVTRLFLFVVLLSISSIAPVQAAPVAVFDVNSQLDEPDANTGDGQCISTPSGKCTLRAAIMQINATGIIVNGINLPPGAYTLTHTGAGDSAGDLDIYSVIGIFGSDASNTIIDGNGVSSNDRVFHIHQGKVVSLQNITILNGRGDEGGAILAEKNTSLTIKNATLMNNIATNGDGGAISSQDDVSLVSTTVYSNSAFYSGGALDVLTGTLTLSNTAIVGNVAGNWGGAIKISNGGLAIQRSLIKDNQADYAGGLSIGNTTGFIRESAIVHNFANDGEGGGLYSSTQNDLELINVTLSANYAENNGGGVYVVGPSELNLANVTIAANTILLANAAGLSLSGGSPTVRMKNSLLANNIDINSSTQVDCWGAIDSYGYNRIEALGANCTLSAFTGDATNVETYIAPLADNGGYQTPLGPLPTHALTSVGIDEGNILFCSDFSANPLQTDQRGFHRPVDSNLDGNTKCDIGAYEKQIEVFLPLIVK